MEDKFVRYTKLYILIFLMFLSIPVIIALLIGIFYGFSKLISSGPVDFIFQLLILSLPAAVFIAAYSIFLKRTKQHPSSIVRICSMIFFVAGLICCIGLLARDIISFFKQPTNDVISYYCYSVAFLAANIGALFLIAIIQAFTTKKEADWMERVSGNDKIG